ncbi:TPA: hypothetical protein R6453_003216, partial [Klebsiella pneumoniae]|nr:hypothetical protein [Klebsiella pneumoniae]HEE1158776.1 hypothetical protein [Klebsiella pneumoniae]
KNNDFFLKDSGKERKSERVFAVAMIEKMPTTAAKTIDEILSRPVEKSLIPYEKYDESKNQNIKVKPGQIQLQNEGIVKSFSVRTSFNSSISPCII